MSIINLQMALHSSSTLYYLRILLDRDYSSYCHLSHIVCSPALQFLCVLKVLFAVTFYFPSINFFKNSGFVLDDILRIIESSQQFHEQLLRILVKFFRILYLFLRISDVVLRNSGTNSWRGRSRKTYEFSEFVRTTHAFSTILHYLF